VIAGDPLLGISPGAGWPVDRLIAQASRAAAGGLSTLLLREVGRSEAELVQIIEALGPILSLRLHVGHPAAARLARERGLSLHAPAWMPPSPLRPASQSAHDEAELARAFEAGCAMALVAPIFSPGSKPGDRRPTLGLLGLARLVAACPLPLFALGGVGPHNAGAMRQAGAAGVATITGIFGPADPAAQVQALRRAWAAGA
jgi:thiamine monophosphate synthase